MLERVVLFDALAADPPPRLFSHRSLTGRLRFFSPPTFVVDEGCRLVESGDRLVGDVSGAIFEQGVSLYF